VDRLRAEGGAIASASRGRRLFLQRAATVAALALARPARAMAVRPRFDDYPFQLGVASGAPRPDSVLLWTRIAPKPLEGGGLGDERCDVRWELASDEGFRRIVRKGVAEAQPARAHALHVEVAALEPAREYFYRFIAGGEASPVGRTLTAPPSGAGVERLRIAVASCQQYEQGYYVSHRHLAREGVDLVAFLGDYIYESSWGQEHVRHHGSPAPRTLADYRNRHALYKTDPDLQRAHACAPWIVIWDDHEVENDYANDRSETLDPQFLARRAAAYQAYYEHMPLRPSVLVDGGGLRIYDRHEWGALATFHALDDRQYRSHQPCPRANRGGSAFVGAACTERFDERLTLLGAEQERWLDAGLAASRARWNVVAQQARFTPAGRLDARGELVHWTDGWDGYPAARQRLLDSIARGRPSNPVIIGGDVHANYVADLRARAGERSSPIVATEFCGTSISSQGSSVRTNDAIKAANPDIHLADPTRRGYVVLDFRAGRLEARLRCVETVKRPESPISTLATFTVEDGRPGARK
jgi:alkaline phosphatase D